MRTYEHYNDYPMSVWRWPSFSPQEIACRGDAKLAGVQPADRRRNAQYAHAGQGVRHFHGEPQPGGVRGGGKRVDRAEAAMIAKFGGDHILPTFNPNASIAELYKAADTGA